MLTGFPETTTRNDRGMIQWIQSALASDTIAQGGIAGVPDKLCPVSMDYSRPGFDDGILDAIEEGRGVIEIRQSDRLQFKTFAGKVRIDELLDCVFRKGRSIDRCETSETWLGALLAGLSTKAFEPELL